jgi:predicted DNA-binding transcriptional regulator AlpA
MSASSLQIVLAARLIQSEGLGGEIALPTEDRLLTVAEAATILGVTPKWLYRHQKLPFVRKLSRKALRVSENGLRRWLATRKA